MIEVFSLTTFNLYISVQEGMKYLHYVDPKDDKTYRNEKLGLADNFKAKRQIDITLSRYIAIILPSYCNLC